MCTKSRSHSDCESRRGSSIGDSGVVLQEVTGHQSLAPPAGSDWVRDFYTDVAASQTPPAPRRQEYHQSCDDIDIHFALDRGGPHLDGVDGSTAHPPPLTLLEKQNLPPPEDVRLPEQGSEEVAYLNYASPQLEDWRTFIHLHRESTLFRVDAQEQRNCSRLLRKDVTQKIDDVLQSLRALPAPDQDLQNGVAELKDLVDNLTRAEQITNEVENTLISHEWAIAAATPAIFRPDHNDESMLEALDADQIDIRGHQSPSGDATFDSDYDLHLEISPDAQAVDRIIQRINVLEDLAVELEDHIHLANSHEGLGERPWSACPMVENENTSNYITRLHAIRHEVCVAHRRLDQLRESSGAPYSTNDFGKDGVMHA